MVLRLGAVSTAVILEEPPFGSGRVVWRTWRLVAEEVPGLPARPLLTGLAGFPWRERDIDARCLEREPAAGGLFGQPRYRHHRVVPHPRCSCGIYATRDGPSDTPGYLRRARDPLVTGFVELSGRIVADGDSYRAQHAAIVGPLAVAHPPRPTPDRRNRVVVESGRYRVKRRPGRAGVPYPEWLMDTQDGLRARYGVTVVALVAPDKEAI